MNRNGVCPSDRPETPARQCPKPDWRGMVSRQGIDDQTTPRKIPDDELRDIWGQFKAMQADDPSRLTLRNRLIENYLHIVRYTAERLKSKLPNSVDVNDLYNDGVLGMMDAIHGFDLARGIKFETYCATRVRGAIIDGLRKSDWVPRLVRQRAGILEGAYRKLESELGRMPTEAELAEELGMTEEEFDNLVKEASAASLISLSRKMSEDAENKEIRKIDVIEDKRQVDPVELLHKQELMDYVTKNLSRKERLVVLLYYYEELTMKEIGLTLDLSESRVCQLHSRVLMKLKSQLSKRSTDLFPG